LYKLRCTRSTTFKKETTLKLSVIVKYYYLVIYYYLYLALKSGERLLDGAYNLIHPYLETYS